MKKGNRFLIDDSGNPILTAEGDYIPNPERISDEAYMTPMIIIANEAYPFTIPGFAFVKKLFKISGSEEISVYLDKTYTPFKEICKVKFDGERLRLVNNSFRDFINLESKF